MIYEPRLNVPNQTVSGYESESPLKKILEDAAQKQSVNRIKMKYGQPGYEKKIPKTGLGSSIGNIF